MKKVLIITYYWPPAGGGGVQRWVKFVKYLRLYGWEPIVYTTQNADYPVLDPTLSSEVPSDITVLRHPIIEPYSWYNSLSGKNKSEKIEPNFLSQGKKMGWKDQLAVWIRGNLFIPDAKRLWIRPSAVYLATYLKSNPVDAIISTGPPHSCHLIAYRILKKNQMPWLVDYRDPWTQIDYFNDLRLTSWAKKCHLRMEKKVLNSCNRIITVGKTMAEDLASLTSNRTEVITNGYDDSDRRSEDETLDTHFSVTYIGTMNDARNPEILWKVLNRLNAIRHPMMQEIKIHLVGKPEKAIIESVNKNGLTDTVDFVGYVSHHEAIRYQNKAQVLLLVINRTSNNKSILTGKIFEYLASGRPILCIGPKDGDAAEIIHEAGNGIVVDYEDEKSIEIYLTQCFEKYKNGTLIRNAAGVDRYSRRNLTGKLSKLLDEVSQSK
jgi:glycosyltransferase involved in cell wall biosynthesis